MNSLFDPETLVGKSTLDAATRLGSCATGCMERLVKLQLDIVNQMIKETTDGVQAALGKSGNSSFFEYWQNAYQANIEKTMELGQRYGMELNKAQTELAQLMAELTTEVNKNTFKNMQDFTKNAMEQGEKMDRLVKFPGKVK